MKRNAILISILIVGLITAAALTRSMDARGGNDLNQSVDEPLYVSGPTAKRLALGFNGLAADWYWMRSLQYVGGKIVRFEDTHNGRVNFGTLADLDLRLLPSLLRVSTTLDPQFMAPYEYGAMLLPEIDADRAAELLNSGIAANPNAWRLYQHLGYVYWQRHDYQKAAQAYNTGARLPGAPPWMLVMGARMKDEGGSRNAAREMYRHLYDASNDKAVQDMVAKQLLRLDSLDDRDAISELLAAYKARNGRCPSGWSEISNQLTTVRMMTAPNSVRAFKLDSAGAPLDPSGAAYSLKDCNVDLGVETQVPRR
jgi:tetratricopeptide (TPR) repeat protein